MNQRERDQKEGILRVRPICEICWHSRATQLHHCLIRDSKRYHDLLTVPENLMPVCERCHTSLEQTANSMTVKVEFAYRQTKVYSYDIGEWYRGLPLKVKEQWILDL